MNIQSLRSLAIVKIINEDLSPDEYPQMLVQEIHTLKKIKNIIQNQTYIRQKQTLLREKRERIDIELDYYSMYIDDEYIENSSNLEEVDKWMKRLQTEIGGRMNENDVQENKLWGSLQNEYHTIAINFIFEVKDDNILLQEIKQRLLELIDERYQKVKYSLRAKFMNLNCSKRERHDALQKLQHQKSYAKFSINRINFTP